MSFAKFPEPPPDKSRRSSLWFEKMMALLVLANYLLVLFDFSYIPLRNFWLQGRVQLFIKIGPFELSLPQDPIRILPFSVTNWYDWVKGIEPNRDTENYLKEVNLLNEKISQQALQSPETARKNAVTYAKEIDAVLKNLRERSTDMIATNPFQIADKTGTLERIKNKMRQHVFGTRDASATAAFNIFWSRPYLSKNGFRRELNFFDNQIKPLIETNYFRIVGENGEFINNFPLLDFPFFVIFLLEFLIRTWLISRHHKGVTWFAAMLWRWYDIFLLIPVFRLLRIIPVLVRLNAAKIVNLNDIKEEAKQGFVASIANEITQVVIIEIINQFQTSIQEGGIRNLVLQRRTNPYIDLNEINESAAIIKIVSQFTIYQILPKLKPDFEAILKYKIEGIFTKLPAYQGLQKLPGVELLETQLAGQLAAQIFQTLLDVLTDLVKEDSAFDKLLTQLVQQFRQTMTTELQAKQSFEQIEYLLTALLEEVKVNYVQRLSDKDIEEIVEQARILRQQSSAAQL